MSWRTHIKKHKINVVTPTNFYKWNIKIPSTFHKLQPALQSDIVRLNLLYMYGGIWMDATIMLLRDLEWLTDYTRLNGQKDSYFALQAYDAEFIENWMISVKRPLNPHILTLRNLLIDTMEYYPEFTKSPPYQGKKYTKNDSYFVMYQCYCYLSKQDGFKKANILPNSVQCAFFPAELHIFDPRYFIKYTTNCRKYHNICQIGIYISYTIIFYFLMRKLARVIS